MDDSGDSNRKPMFPWMVGAEAAQAPKTAPKRRQTMAEMLRSSQLLDGTVALHEAVEAAQEAAARKAEATEAPPPPVDEISIPADVASPVPVIFESPAIAPIPNPVREPRAGGNRYNLYAKINGIWIWQFAVDAMSHVEGLNKSVARVTPDLEGAPIRMEQDESAA